MIKFPVSRLVRVGCPMVLALPLAGPAAGDFFEWSALTGDWDTDANWINQSAGNPDREPDGSDTATVLAGGSVEVTLAGEVADGLRIDGGLSILGGGLTTHSGQIGWQAGSDATANVTGAGSVWSVGDALRVGNLGTGGLNITAGGMVSGEAAVIADGEDAVGVATVAGAGSAWDNTDEVFVGLLGDATLNIEDGGVMSNTAGNVGSFAGATGVVTVSGAGSAWNNTALYLGGTSFEAGGTGSLGVLDGGTVDVSAGPLKIWNTGTLTLDGGTVNANGGFDNSHGGTFSFNDGALTVTGGAFSPNTGGDFRLDGAAAGDRVHLTLGAGASSVIGPIRVGFRNEAQLTLTDGVVLTSDSADIAAGFNTSIGTVTVTGAGSAWHPDAIFLGSTGVGTLNIENGGLVSHTNCFFGNDATGTGVANVTGTGSAWDLSRLSIGYRGSGTLDIEDGGVVNSGLTELGAIDGNATGSVTVTGAGSTLNAGTLRIGDFGSGTLNILDGGLVSNTGHSYLATFSNPNTSMATVSGAGSTWNTGGTLTVGVRSIATLDIADGGVVSSAVGRIASDVGSNAMVTVTGAGSAWAMTGDLVIGGSGASSGDGRLSILDQGRVEVGGELSVWEDRAVLIDEGTLVVSGIDAATYDRLDFVSGTLRITGDDVTIGAGGPFGSELLISSSYTYLIDNQATIAGGGTLVVSGGFGAGQLTNYGQAVFIDTTVTGAVNNPAGSTVDIVGDVVFTGLFSGGGGVFGSGTADFQGGFAPGDSPAHVTIEGSAKLGTANTLFIELGGTTRGTEYDSVVIAGHADLAGSLDVTFLDAFAPSAGDTFDILDWGTLSGTFDTVNLAALDPSLRWDVADLYVTGELAVGLTGDYTGDGLVGVEDLDLLLANWGDAVTPGDYALGDGNGDGLIGSDDLALVQAHWGNGTPGSPGGGVIPEPGSLALLGLGGLALMHRRRQR
ncbi:PEP-CTERM sorting domain-containing protein [Phycisphaeraceae bacterium D3-23]